MFKQCYMCCAIDFFTIDCAVCTSHNGQQYRFKRKKDFVSISCGIMSTTIKKNQSKSEIYLTSHCKRIKYLGINDTIQNRNSKFMTKPLSELNIGIRCDYNSVQFI